MTLTIDLAPMPAPRMTRSDKWKKRPVVDKYFAWRDAFVLLCKQQGWSLKDMIDITFCLPMPQSWSEKKKNSMEGEPHKQRPDIDNLLKSVQDAFRVEDGFVCKVRMEKIWSRTGKIEIHV